MNQSKPTTNKFALICLLGLIPGLAITLATYQLLPSQHLTSKLERILVGVFIVTFFGSGILNRRLVYRLEFSPVRWVIVLAIAALLSGSCVYFFQFSFPQKEFTIPKRVITLKTIAEKNGNSAETRHYNFLSLHNGYRGISLSEFTTEGDWVRRGDRLERIAAPADPGSITFTGRSGHEIFVYLAKTPAGGTFKVDWGDGSSETVSLAGTASENDKDEETVEPFRVGHVYYDRTFFFEWLDFLINLSSVFGLLFYAWTFYVALLFRFLDRRTPSFRRVFVALTFAAVLMRGVNVATFPLGWDEGTYSRAAMRYADSALKLDLKNIPAIDYNHEHPALVKLAFALPVIVDGRDDFARIGVQPYSFTEKNREDYAILTSRVVSSFFNVVTVQALTYLIHPLAAFFFLIHTVMSEMGAMARLESIPTLFSFLAVFFAWRALRGVRVVYKGLDTKFDRRSWFLAAACLGVTAASKIIYCIVAIPIILSLIVNLVKLTDRRSELIRNAVLFALLALTTFFLFNPSLWYDPFGRVQGMFLFHRNYQDHQKELYPAWQPFLWIIRSVPLVKPGLIGPSPLQREPYRLWFAADEIIVLLALFGLGRVQKRMPILNSWLICGVLFMLVWGTKWQHYACILTVPLCIAATYGARELTLRVSRYDKIPGNNRL